MIVKERNPHEHHDGGKRSAAGARAEAQMAHYLQRAFGDASDVWVFNDLRLPAEAGDAAQIDHLILYRGGFILIESKSVTSTVQITQGDEWRRLWNREWEGMASPVQQLKRQVEFLRKRLRAEAETLRRKALFGLVQQGFGNVPFDLLVAISDDGLIERRGETDLPVYKADQVVDRIRERMAYRNVSFLAFTTRQNNDAEWVCFEPDEVERILAFLCAQHTPVVAREHQEAPRTPLPAPVRKVEPAPAAPIEPAPVASSVPYCRQCQSVSVEVRYGRNYYLGCLACGKNTPIQLTCTGCGGQERIRREGLIHYRECKPCSRSEIYHRNPGG